MNENPKRSIGGYTVEGWRSGSKISVSIGGGTAITFDIYEWDELNQLIRDIINSPIK